jgi:hypothetical protein
MKPIKTFLVVCRLSLLIICCRHREAEPGHSQGHAEEMANTPLTTDEVITKLKSGNEDFAVQISSRNL